MPAPGDAEEFERELRRTLYRFDCPDPHTLGEYQLDLLDLAERTRIAAHTLECDDCRAELHTLRTFLAAPTRVAEPALGRVRRIVATLVAPRPGLAYGGLRGASDNTTRLFEAGDVTVSIGPGQTPGSLIGLVVATDQSPEALEGAEVRLVPGEGPALTTRLDDLGNFSIDGVAAGQYALEIDLPGRVVVIEDLRVD